MTKAKRSVLPICLLFACILLLFLVHKYMQVANDTVAYDGLQVTEINGGTILWTQSRFGIQALFLSQEGEATAVWCQTPFKVMEVSLTGLPADHTAAWEHAFSKESFSSAQTFHLSHTGHWFLDGAPIKDSLDRNFRLNLLAREQDAGYISIPGFVHPFSTLSGAVFQGYSKLPQGISLPGAAAGMSLQGNTPFSDTVGALSRLWRTDGAICYRLPDCRKLDIYQLSLLLTDNTRADFCLVQDWAAAPDTSDYADICVITGRVGCTG